MTELSEELLPKQWNYSAVVTSARGASQKPSRSVIYEKISPKTKEIYHRSDLFEWRSSDQVSSFNDQFQEKELFMGSSIAPHKQPIDKKSRSSITSMAKNDSEGTFFKLRRFKEKEDMEMTLNSRIFKLNTDVQSRLYIFNVFMNLIWRCSLLAISMLFTEEGKYFYIQILGGAFLLTLLLYSLAIGKMIYTRKDRESVEMQKRFFKKDYFEIQEDMVWRKHFTFHKILNSFLYFWNPNSSFNNCIKISLIKQEIYKRVESVCLSLPFVILFVLRKEDFSFGYLAADMVITGVICLEIIRSVTHYLVVYVCS